MPDLFEPSEPAELRVHHADAHKLLLSFSKHAAQVIIADPPYGTPLADPTFPTARFFAAVHHALHPCGALYLFTRWDMYPAWASALPEGLHLDNVIVWQKDNDVQQTAAVPVRTFAFRHEFVLMITKGNHELRGRRLPNVWNIPRPRPRRVPGEKPVGLIRQLITSSSSPGDLVVDPFCGSGTTGLAAAERRVVLGDVDPAMVRHACYRLKVDFPEGLEAIPEPWPACPILGRQTNAPHLWGLHPEDLAEFLSQD